MTAKMHGNPDTRSETTALLDLLLADFELSTLAAVLTVDERTLRRWRSGEDAGHTARKLMRCVLALKRLAPGVLSEMPGWGAEEIPARLDEVTARYLTDADLARERRNQARAVAESGRRVWE